MTVQPYLRHYLHTGQRTCHADDGTELACAGSGQDASFGVGMRGPDPRFGVCDDKIVDHLATSINRYPGFTLLGLQRVMQFRSMSSVPSVCSRRKVR